MFWVVENNEQLVKLSTKNYKEAYLDIIPLCPYNHPLSNGISLIYLRPLNRNRGYIISINHNESLPAGNISEIEEFLNSFTILYTLDKKESLHYLKLNNLIDVGFNGSIKPPHKTQAHKFFYKQTTFKFINKLIPLSKHYEACETDYHNNMDLYNPNVNKFLNGKFTQVFNQIEKNGLYINTKIFEEFFYKPSTDIIYTQYNLKTPTTRPSNSFMGVNYVALDKKNGCRKAFIPRNNYLLEMDIKSYHPTLIAQLVGYDFKGQNPHTYLANLYGKTYQEAKLITFRQIYGGIWDEYKEIIFFQKIQEYIDHMWKKFTEDGYIEVPISKHIFKQKNLPDIKKQTLFNYLLQALETSSNVEIMEKILKILENSHTKLIHYTYDSLLFDVDNSERSIFREIAQQFKENNLKLSIKVGETYDF